MYALGLASPVSMSGTLVPVLVTLGGMVWGFFIHANVNWRFGPLEWIISTPGFHHWHHTNDGPEVINKNYAPMLPWVDWMFGSLYLPKDKQPVKYGIDQPISPILFGQLVEPFLFWRKNLPAQAGTAEGAPVAAPATVPGSATLGDETAAAADALAMNKTE